jgi:Xaa-Pro aminopeptidase
METMQPTLKNGRNIWDRINMPQSEFQERLKKIRRTMKTEGIDTLLLYGNAFNEYGNYCYLSNYVIRLARGAMVVVQKKGEVALLFEGASRGIPSVKKTTWIEDVRACGDVAAECVKYLKERNLASSTLGFVGAKDLMPAMQWRFLSQALSGSKVLDADELLKQMRMIKSQREVDQVRRASRIISNAFDFICRISFPVKGEEVLEAMVRREARLGGAEDFRMMIARPTGEKWAFHPSEAGEISPGETLILYLAVEFERYWAEAIRTFVVKEGAFERVEQQAFQALYEKVRQAIRPGKTVSQFYKETIEDIHRSHFEFIPDYGFGEGIGLSPKEFPLISGDVKVALMEGMCFTLRLGMSDRELGAMMLGNTLHLMKKGPEVLTT